ncbi:MAG: LysR family transcriptional regulator [Armatimonadota bacterium]|nr:LysR family transcriptional regulator [Armatimonadota bacterium]
MEVHQLISFLQVASEGSVTRAADRLYLTQPAVTKQLQALERELGARLFERTGRGVELTEAGTALLDYAQRSLSLLDECRQVISDIGAGAAGRLVIGAGVTTSIFQLPAWLRRLQESYPGLDIVVRTGGSKQIAASVLHREIELGLVTSPVEDPAICSLPLYKEEITLVADPRHPFAGQTVEGEELAAAPFILFPEGTGFREYLDHTLSLSGLKVKVKMESDSVEAIKSFVGVGLGLSFLPQLAVAGEMESGILACVSVKGMEPLRRTTAAIYRKDRRLSVGARALIGILTGGK